jgi:hypothetical protein
LTFGSSEPAQPNSISPQRRSTVKKSKKIEIKKITLKDLDEPEMNYVAGGIETVVATCPLHTQTCCKTSCFGAA